jgi:hypothetical protein
MIALYGFERFGTGMTVGQLGEMWKEYRAGSWGSSEQARLALERGIAAPLTGHPRHNRWFHTIGPEFSADLYGMIAPGMVNLAGALARRYSHVGGYAEGSDGAVRGACVGGRSSRPDGEDRAPAASLIDRARVPAGADQALAAAAGMRLAQAHCRGPLAPQAQMDNAVPAARWWRSASLRRGGPLKTLSTSSRRRATIPTRTATRPTPER